jgi:oligopeptide transport system permease protein
MHAIPGGPFKKEKALPPAVQRNIEERYKLNDPLWKQYTDYLKNLVRGDLGPSFKYLGRSVNDIIRDGFPVSATLGAWAILFALVVGVPAGIISALNQNKWQDNVVMAIAIIGVSVPNFVIATLLMYVFAVKLRWLPVAMWGTPKHVILPMIALAGFPAAFFARLMRSSTLDVLSQDYIRTARAKGLSWYAVVVKHVVKNAILPVVTYLGPLIAGILTGSFVVENIFAIPGLGRYYVTSIYNRDYTTIMGVTIFYSAFLVLLNFLVDIAYGWIDPRIKLVKAKE